MIVQDVLVKDMRAIIETCEKNDDNGGSEKTCETIPERRGSSEDVWVPGESSQLDKGTKLKDWKKASQCTKIIREIEDAVRKTCEFSQRSVSNLFSVRKDVQATYTMPQLRLLYDATMEFVVSVEKLTAKTDYTLRGSLFSQLKLFLEKYHQVQTAKLISTLDHELWKNTEISASRHKALEDLSSGRGVPLVLSDDREVTGEVAPPVKTVSICGKSFRVVWSVLLMLEIVMNYMSCAANFPVLATDVLQRSIEIFRLFNSRTTQLVLGAGAMQMARLKSISARHLAVASQSLELSMILIPHIRAALAAHFTDRQKLLLEEFDRVLRDYAEHDEKIFSKFTSIVEDQVKRYLENAGSEINYDTPDLVLPTTPLNSIAQTTLKLCAVLKPVLPTPQMKDVLTRVFDMFALRIPEYYAQVQPTTPNGKQRVLEDVALFVNSFASVEVMSWDGKELQESFRSLYTS